MEIIQLKNEDEEEIKIKKNEEDKEIVPYRVYEKKRTKKYGNKRENDEEKEEDMQGKSKGYKHSRNKYKNIFWNALI